ncbi:MAG: hypothetical protein KO316_03775 [Methanobacterium sp.]|nr:hypothetical protein [Methanobacterium sp.]
MDSITDLEKRIEVLRETDSSSYNILKGIYRFDSGHGTQVIPYSFKNKISEYFGKRDSQGNIIEPTEDTISRINNQKIIKVYNKWTGEGSLFNSLRAQRPGISSMDQEKEKKYIHQLVQESEEKCDFCHPEEYTPEDVFGRIRGNYSITAANVAKYDVWSSLVIFNQHNPLNFGLKEFSDYLDTGFAWFEAVNNHSPQFRFPFFIWNCLSRAGASQVHGHSQILMSKDPYARVETQQKAFKLYKLETGDDYFHDLCLAHDSLGLSENKKDFCFFASITPVKEKEMVVITHTKPSTDENVKKTIFKILRCFIDFLGVYSFNLSISCPPIDNEDEFPYLIKIVDRGSLLKPTGDIGGMELYGSSVVADDPYNVMNSIKEHWKQV